MNDNTTHPARRFLVVDLEATCCTDQSIPRKEREVIEIGAVIYDTAEAQVIARFEQRVRPQRHPQLTEFCTRLTGITQADADAAETFPVVFDAFTQWVQSFGEVIFLHWGSYDRKALMADCLHHGVTYTLPTTSIDFKKSFYHEMAFGKPNGLGQTLKNLGMQFVGRAHSALSDAENTARLLPMLIEKNPRYGCTKKVVQHQKSTRSKEGHYV